MEKIVGKIEVALMKDAALSDKKFVMAKAHGGEALARLTEQALRMPALRASTDGRIVFDIAARIEYHEVRMTCPMCGATFTAPADKIGVICAHCGCEYREGAGWMHKGG